MPKTLAGRKTLVIVESPSKARHIQHILGSGYVVAASMGHVRDLPVKRMGIAPPRFRLEYEATKRGAGTLRRLRSLAKTADRYILATDPDREGEAIAWHLQAALRLPASKTSRVTYHAVTERAVKAAFEVPRKIDMDLVHAQEARRGLDRLVGYTLSGVVSDAVHERASAGRVQTPALRLVVERERERQAFRSTTHYGARLHFGPADSTADWDTKPHRKPGDRYLLDRALAECAAAARRLKVASVERKERLRHAPPPFATSTMLQAAAKAGIPGTRAMAAAQSLFEAGLITYHRTDSVHIEPEAVAAIRAYARAKGYAVPDKPNVHKTKSAGAQEAHEAIRPTDVRRETEKAFGGGESLRGGDASRLYAMIHRRAVASQLAPERAEVTETKLVSIEAGPSAGFSYGMKVVRVLEPGFTVLYSKGQQHSNEDISRGTPSRDGGFKAGDKITASEGEVLTLQTEPPPHYTEATLLKELERRGIGRPSTWASILDTLRRRRYVESRRGPDRPARGKNAAPRRAPPGLELVPTPLGERLIEAVVGAQFSAYDYTAKMEQALDAIAAGKAGYEKVMAEGYAEIQRDLIRIPPAKSAL
jgi:DNA topoisomerase-1